MVKDFFFGWFDGICLSISTEWSYWVSNHCFKIKKKYYREKWGNWHNYVIDGFNLRNNESQEQLWNSEQAPTSPNNNIDR